MCKFSRVSRANRDHERSSCNSTCILLSASRTVDVAQSLNLSSNTLDMMLASDSVTPGITLECAILRLSRVGRRVSPQLAQDRPQLRNASLPAHSRLYPRIHLATLCSHGLCAHSSQHRCGHNPWSGSRTTDQRGPMIHLHHSQPRVSLIYKPYLL